MTDILGVLGGVILCPWREPFLEIEGLKKNMLRALCMGACIRGLFWRKSNLSFILDQVYLTRTSFLQQRPLVATESRLCCHLTMRRKTEKCFNL